MNLLQLGYLFTDHFSVMCRLLNVFIITPTASDWLCFLSRGFIHIKNKFWGYIVENWVLFHAFRYIYWLNLALYRP